MNGYIFTIQQDGSLVRMQEEPFQAEDIFQELLGKYPDLLAGDQIDSDKPRRWLLVKREMGISSEPNSGDRWSIDHLFLDQEGIPTLVEVKRKSDTRIRREVVGQMLDYAANAIVHWSIEQIQESYDRSCVEDGVNADERLIEFLADDSTVEEFWARTKTNLQAGKVRMLFVADEIPTELKRIIEFLNEQMDPAEVLGVELRNYEGHGVKTLVPRVVGQTSSAKIKKSAGTPGSRSPGLTLEKLQDIADQRGTGNIYRSLFQKISSVFNRYTTSRSTISFITRTNDVKNASVFSLEPGDSDPSRGVRYYAYTKRISELANLDHNTVLEFLPDCELDDPVWGGGRYKGYARENGLDEIIERLLKDSN